METNPFPVRREKNWRRGFLCARNGSGIEFVQSMDEELPRASIARGGEKRHVRACRRHREGNSELSRYQLRPRRKGQRRSVEVGAIVSETQPTRRNSNEHTE